VLPHVVQEILLLAEHVAARVTLVLYTSRVNGHVFFETV
jgi:hypothetical protein